MKIVTVECDWCKTDLTAAPLAYRFVLGSELLPARGGPGDVADTANIVIEPLHFCNRDCLRKWLPR